MILNISLSGCMVKLTVNLSDKAHRCLMNALHIINYAEEEKVTQNWMINQAIICLMEKYNDRCEGLGGRGVVVLPPKKNKIHKACMKRFKSLNSSLKPVSSHKPVSGQNR